MPTLIDRLRAGADNIHSIGPVRAADLMREAADALAVPPSGRRPTRPSGSLDELKQALWSASKHVEMDLMLAAVAGELEADRADDPDLSTPIGAPSLAVAEQFDAEVRAAAEDPGAPGDAFELSEGIDLWPGSGLPPLMSATTKARIEQWMKRRVDPEPRGESYTPEQEAEAAEQAERFQGLDDSDRE